MMPSQRRVKLVFLFVIVTIVVLLYMSRAAHQTQTSDFYTKTQQALQEREYQEAVKQRDAESVDSRLRAAEEQAKKAANVKYASVKDSVEGPGQKNVAGRLKLEKDDKKVPGVAAQGGKAREQAILMENETMEDHEVEMELNAILKKSPMIIFSKSYCPYSKKAKHILLEKYQIVPEPHVVELDISPMGSQLQSLLAHMTGRKTVPNILLIGRSIGGGDDMEALDEADTLVGKIKEIGGTRITEIARREARTEIRRKRRMA